MSNVQARANYYLVDSRGEGGLVSELDRVAMVDEPTLIIGLGGTGADALLNAKYVLHRKLRIPEGQEKPSRLAYLAIDTDANDLLKKRVGDIQLHPDEKCDITEMNLKTYMSNHSMITQPYLRDWLSKGIPPLTVAFGAGGVRQYGRFMLLSKAEAVSQKIQNAIAQIWAAGKENGAGFSDTNDSVNVYILAGISGGTGSGTFLDIAYMVREIVTRRMFKHLRLRGMIFMPDVNMCKVTSAEVKKYLPVNGYAALKELDFWMNPERGRRFTQQYTSNLTVDTNDAPFDLCFLISPNGKRPEDYATCMQTTGETILNVLSASENSKEMPQGFESFISNLVSMLPHVTKPYTGNYIFAAMGMDERRLQLDQMATYIAYYLLVQVEKLFDRQPLKEEVAGFYKTLSLEERSMERLFNQKLNVKPYPGVKDLESFKEAIADYNHSQVLDQNLLEQELDLWARQCEIFYTKQRDGMVEGRMETLAQQIEKLFADQENGPYFAHRMLHNPNVGAPDVLKTLAASMNKLESFLLTAENMREMKLANCRKAKESARKSRFVPLMAGAKYDDFIEAVFELYNHDRYTRFAQILHKAYKELAARIVDYNNMIVGKFSSLLQALTEVFRSNSNIITDVKLDGSTHTWNVFNFSDIRPHIDRAIEEMRHEGKTAMLVHEFLQMMLDERDAWLDENGDLGASFSRFVSEKFGEIMNLSLENHYKAMLGFKTDGELKEHILGSVMPQLQRGAEIMYQANSALCPVENAAVRSLVSYPHVATTIGNAVKDYVDQDTSLTGNCDVLPSHRRGSIFWFQCAFGLPMYSFNPIANYQAAYDAYGLVDHHLGRHLKMGADENWAEFLPPLMPDSTWDYQGYQNPALAKKNDDNRAMFYSAWENNLVLPMKGADGKFVLGRADEEALEKLLASAPLSAEDQKLIAEQGAAAAASVRADLKQVSASLAEARAFAQTGWEETDEMFKSDVFGTLRGGVIVDRTAGDKRTCQILSENLTLTPDVADKLRHQLMLKQRLLAVIAAHETFTQLGDLEKSQRQFFAQCLFYGLYRKIPPKLYQLDGAAEGVSPFMLMAINDYALAPAKDKYYAMYRKFVSLTEEQKAVMRKLVEMRIKQIDNEMLTGNLTRYTQYIETIQTMDAEIEKRITEIAMDATYDHPEILEFYLALRNEFALWLAE